MIGYYVTVKRGNQTGWLYGPIGDHDACKMFVEHVRRIACKLDPWCDFDAFGTSSITIDGKALKDFPQGRLNNAF